MNKKFSISVALFVSFFIAMLLTNNSGAQFQSEGPLSPLKSASFINSKSHDGEELSCDLPGSFHMKNIGSAKDGAGMCVDSSIEMAAVWQGLDEYKGFRNYWASVEGGGNMPSGVDRQVKAWCAKKGIPLTPYVQYQGKDPRPILELCDKTGRMACITYGYSPRYGPGVIYHMTCCPKFSGKYAVCLDNNFPGEESYEWMSLDEMVNRVKFAGGSGWVFVWLVPSPPPIPHN